MSYNKNHITISLKKIERDSLEALRKEYNPKMPMTRFAAEIIRKYVREGVTKEKIGRKFYLTEHTRKEFEKLTKIAQTDWLPED